MPIVLHGGRKSRKVERITRKGYLGGAGEGVVYKVEVVFKKAGKRGKRERKITLAEKTFFKKKALPNLPNFRNPFGQFKTMQELLRLNREKKLGLRIIPTIRLRKREGKRPTLIITKLNTLGLGGLSDKRREEFEEDRKRQMEMGQKNSYYIDPDAFEPVLDKKTMKVISVITDFGNVKKL